MTQEDNCFISLVCSYVIMGGSFVIIDT